MLDSLGTGERASYHSKSEFLYLLIWKALFLEILGYSIKSFQPCILYGSDHSFLLTLLYWVFVEACVHGLVGSYKLCLKFSMLICPVELCAQILKILSPLQC